MFASKGKAKPAPDFTALHNKWRDQFARGKACRKKPCTQVFRVDMIFNITDQ